MAEVTERTREINPPPEVRSFLAQNREIYDEGQPQQKYDAVFSTGDLWLSSIRVDETNSRRVFKPLAAKKKASPREDLENGRRKEPFRVEEKV